MSNDSKTGAISTTTLLPNVVGERGIAAILSFCVNSVGLTAYFLVCYILIKHQKQFNNPFYVLALSLAVPDCITGILELIYAIPSRLFGEHRMPFWYQSIIGYLSVGSWFMITSHMAVISVNRLLAVTVFTKYKQLFSPTKTAIMIGCCYVYGFAMVTMMYACDCRLVFPDFAWLFNCRFETCASTALYVNMIMSNATVVFIALCYIVIFLQIRHTSRKISNSNDASASSQFRKELKMVVQFGAIASALIAYESTFWIIPPLMEKSLLSPTIGSIIINTFCNINSCVSPILYLMFSSEIREKVVCGNEKSTTIVHCHTLHTKG